MVPSSDTYLPGTFTESVFVTRHSTQARMLLGHYLVGMSFYVSAGLLAGMRSVRSSGTVAACAWIVFAAASMGQFQCHRQLAALRPTSTADTRQAYVRPHGSWFRWSYTPHYQLEMVIYAAMWALAGGLHGTSVGQDNGMSWCLLWVVVNLGILSAENRRWYAATAHVGDFGKAQ